MGTQIVFLKTPLCANTGYGHDGFHMTRAFAELGWDVRLIPVSVVPPIPMGIAQMLVKGLDVSPDLFIHHVDPGIIGLTDGEKTLPCKKIAWTMWEFTNLTDELAEGMVERLDGYDLLCVYDEISKQSLAPFAEKAGVPIKVIQGGYWAEETKVDPRSREWDGPFRFCMVGQLHLRKNPFAAINAMEEVVKEFPDAELHLKTTVRSLHPAMMDHRPWLKIHYELWPRPQLLEFYQQMHCYVAPSWGEGKNLPAMEAMTTGIPVIYSDFGGHRQWGSSEVGWPVGGELQAHEGELFSMRVDHDELVKAMKEAAGNRTETRRKGEAAARLIPPMCDWSAVLKRLLSTV